jgi:16S rRNA processing protein RimM
MDVAAARAETLSLGVFGRAHGVRGELVFHPHNPQGARLEALKFPFAAMAGPDTRGGPGAPRPIRLLGARRFEEGALVRLEGIVDRDAAAALTNRELLVPRAVLPPLGPGEFYVVDLLGCRVIDQTGRARGTVVGAYWNGQHDVLTIRAPKDDRAQGDPAELLLPAVPDFLREVDLQARQVVVDDHAGDDHGDQDDAADPT